MAEPRFHVGWPIPSVGLALTLIVASHATLPQVLSASGTYSAVSLVTADPPCPNDSGARYVDCGNGTVTDNRTGLVWLADASCLKVAVTWQEAMEFVAGLADEPDGLVDDPSDCGLSDGSSAGEWRLPSVAEWEEMVELAMILECHPAITDDAGSACWSEECADSGLCSFSEVMSTFYWSATTGVTAAATVWSVDLEFGFVGFGSRTADWVAWPVRGQ